MSKGSQGFIRKGNEPWVGPHCWVNIKSLNEQLLSRLPEGWRVLKSNTLFWKKGVSVWALVQRPDGKICNISQKARRYDEARAKVIDYFLNDVDERRWYDGRHAQYISFGPSFEEEPGKTAA